MRTDAELVVAKYNEDVEWISHVQLPVILYDKNPKVQPMPWKGDHVTHKIKPNVGREAETYLGYILERYDSLPDLIFFSQGCPFEHSFDFMERLNHKYDCPTTLTEWHLDDERRKLFADQDEEFYVHEHLCRLGMANHHCQWGQDWIKHIWQYTFDCPMPGIVRYGYSNMYVVPKKYILSRPLTAWRWLYTECISSSDKEVFANPPLTPWSFEALMYYIWLGNEYPILKSI